jgi:hypothetical protein
MASSSGRDAPGTHRRPETGRVIGALGLSAAPAAVPFATAALRPVFGIAVLAAELAFALVLSGIAIFGTQEQADRVFRLLRWLRNRAEPPAPPSRSATIQTHSSPPGHTTPSRSRTTRDSQRMHPKASGQEARPAAHPRQNR